MRAVGQGGGAPGGHPLQGVGRSVRARGIVRAERAASNRFTERVAGGDGLLVLAEMGRFHRWGKAVLGSRWWVGFRERDPKAGVLMERWWEALSIVGLFSSSLSPRLHQSGKEPSRNYR